MTILIKALLIAGTALDSHSSWKATSHGFHEGNPLLASSDGRYRMRGVGINIAISGGLIGIGEWRMRRHPKEKKRILILQGSMAVTKLGVAGRNYWIDR